MPVSCDWLSDRFPGIRGFLAATLLLALAGCAGGLDPAMPVADSHGVMTLDVGGMPVKFQPIDGWCPASRDLTRSVLREAQEEIKVLVVFGGCKEMRTAHDIDDPIPNFGMLAVPTEMWSTDIGNDRAAFVDLIAENLGAIDLAAAMKEEMDSRRAQIQSRIDAAKRAGMTLQVDDPIDLGLLVHDDDAACFGVNLRVVTGLASSDAYTKDIGIVTLFCATELQGRAVICMMQTQLEPSPRSSRSRSLEPVLKLVRSQVKRLIELNPDQGLAI
ncbi:hypothetical protein FRZ61_10120 [Hypericibacter adhaerens]|jgi:hypothetical protein|uniref:Uncharacterized protein n=2 Tax=Hypericibacter adhaerens TaxID=2602016 RepID=A0A5J6MUZ6_9PROT|nr:hypothetical protein FRZ61_10120 [Hypericibacter adhaerens]